MALRLPVPRGKWRGGGRLEGAAEGLIVEGQLPQAPPRAGSLRANPVELEGKEGATPWGGVGK